MTQIKILNGHAKFAKTISHNNVWCDRRSVLGNPFELSGEESRDLVCDAYQHYFDEVLAGGNPLKVALALAEIYGLRIASRWKQSTREQFMAELKKLEALTKTGNLELACWCSPKRCHCDTIAAYLRERLELNDENTVKQGSLF